MRGRNWTLEGDNYILENFNKLTMTDIAKYLGCSIITVRNRAQKLGLNVEIKQIRRWTEEEILLLQTMAPKYLNKTIARKLNRSLKEINQKARELNIKLIFKRPVWNRNKINYLKKNINKISLRKIEKELEVNYYQIMDMLDELNIEYISNNWTEEEEEILKDLSTKVYIREIAKVLNRTEAAIIRKAKKMGLDYITLKKQFTDEELQYIQENWGKVSINEMARQLKVSRMMISNQGNMMNLPKLGNNPYRKWTEEELDKLTKLAKTKTITQLAKKFNTTNTAIIALAYEKGIELIDSKVHWTKEDNEKLKELAQTKDLSEIATIMNRSTSAIRLQMQRQNIDLIANKKHSIHTWNDDDSLELQRLASEGKSVLKVAKIMNKSDQIIINKAKALNINIKQEPNEPWTEEEINKLKELAKIKKLNEIVYELNRTSASIREAAKTHNINILSDKKSWTKEEYDLLQKLIMVDKKTPAEVAQILGRSEDAIIIKISRKGLKIQTNDKRYWTSEEEALLSDLWGAQAVEKIAEKLNRTVSSVINKATSLGLGSYIESNYEGLTIKDISNLLNVNADTIRVGWVSLGLKCKVKKISKSKSYRYVEIKDLYDFLEANQNIWDSRNLEKNILGTEPDWLKEKRKKDQETNLSQQRLQLTKQQLILAKKFFLELKEKQNEGTKEDNQAEKTMILVKK